MVKSAGERQGSSVAPFLKKLYEMVDDEATNSIISWSPRDDSFTILDMTHFSVHLLPKYFKHSNFSSFMRQLNIYGFRKIETDCWEFATDGFVKGQKHLLKNIYRRKNIQGTDQRKASQPQDNSEGQGELHDYTGLWKEVENLKIDKNAVMQELVKLRQQQETSENKMLLLRDRLQGMEKNQQQMLSFLVMAVQSPGFLVQFLQPKEKNWRMADAGNMLEQIPDDNQVPSNGLIVRYQRPIDELPAPLLPPVSGLGKQQESDPFPDGMKDFFLNSDFMKVLMDEKLDNHSQFVLPDVQDVAWEQLLLASTVSCNSDNVRKVDDEREPMDHEDHELDMETIDTRTHEENLQDFELLIKQMEKGENFGLQPRLDESYIEKSNTVNLMELMASDQEILYETPAKMQGH
ncbi:heat stress transcription factor A-8-like isoform X1 [Cucurbita moschata]|uniref:Heat stress transcription factor A-8-like isoform X1 n=1 Tax=Cucurbita moschata TaxID=3662 RepID=A0A6J1FNX4_CUCMO|nr:heat stress transcription factor A-8-like isoform X1 [Cucurbita moschata]